MALHCVLWRCNLCYGGVLLCYGGVLCVMAVYCVLSNQIKSNSTLLRIIVYNNISKIVIKNTCNIYA